MKSELIKTANENTLVSWLLSSSNAPIPSVSITTTLILAPYGSLPSTGVPHIQSPFVQGFTVGPTENPFWRFSNIRFIRYDLPER